MPDSLNWADCDMVTQGASQPRVGGSSRLVSSVLFRATYAIMSIWCCRRYCAVLLLSSGIEKGGKKKDRE